MPGCVLCQPPQRAPGGSEDAVLSVIFTENALIDLKMKIDNLIGGKRWERVKKGEKWKRVEKDVEKGGKWEKVEPCDGHLGKSEAAQVDSGKGKGSAVTLLRCCKEKVRDGKKGGCGHLWTVAIHISLSCCIN